ncbi:MAG: hypothetical protein ABSH41_14690 [Syntrophobacteraceae bacterium]
MTEKINRGQVFWILDLVESAPITSKDDVTVTREADRLRGEWYGERRQKILKELIGNLWERVGEAISDWVQYKQKHQLGRMEHERKMLQRWKVLSKPSND